MSRQILKQTMRTMRDHKDLYPLIGLGMLAFLAGFAAIMGVMYAVGGFDVDTSAAFPMLGQLPALAIGSIAFVPFVLLMGRYQMAFAFALFQRLNGRACSRRDALQRANGLMGSYLRWTLIASLAGFVISLLGVVVDRFRWIPGLGSLIQIVGVFGWATAAFFVIPIIIVERERSATEALRRSTGIARRQWGKSVTGIVTVSLVVMVPMMIVLFALMGLFMFALFNVAALTAATGDGAALLAWIMPVFFGIVILVAGVASTISMFLQGAYQVILYAYDRTGKILGAFGPETVVEPWMAYRADDVIRRT